MLGEDPGTTPLLPHPHLPRRGTAGSGADLASGEAGSRNWGGGDARPASVLAPRAAPSSPRAGRSLSSAAPPRAPVPLCSLLLPLPRLPPLARARPASRSRSRRLSRRSRTPRERVKPRGGAWAHRAEGRRWGPGEGARGGGGGAHRWSPSDGSGEAGPRGVPTPPGVPAPEKPGRPGGEEEVLGAPRLPR